jgi:hypothetical protein
MYGISLNDEFGGEIGGDSEGEKEYPNKEFELGLLV